MSLITAWRGRWWGTQWVLPTRRKNFVTRVLDSFPYGSFVGIMPTATDDSDRVFLAFCFIVRLTLCLSAIFQGKGDHGPRRQR